MKVLVTGAGGHIGDAAARHLAEAGHEVIAAVRAPNSTLPNTITQLSVDFSGDFRESLAPALQGCEAIVHCAADLSDDATSLSPTRVNALATHALLILAEQSGVRRFVHLSGFNVLATPLQLPITEEHPCAPRGIYALSKWYAEGLVREADGAGRIEGVILRVSSPVGPGMRRKRLFSICADAAASGAPITLHGEGGRRQDFVDVRDVASAIALAIEKPVRGVFNIASGKPVSNRELAETCIGALDSSSIIAFSGQPDPDESLSWDIRIDKARHELGYAPQVDLAQSIRDYREWKSDRG